MQIYKIRMMSGTEIPLREDELDAVLKGSQGKGLIMTSYGIVNAASIDSITLHKEIMASLDKAREMRSPTPGRDVLGDSPFAKQLLGKNNMKALP